MIYCAILDSWADRNDVMQRTSAEMLPFNALNHRSIPCRRSGRVSGVAFEAGAKQDVINAR